MCELEDADGVRVITTRWVEFLRGTGARVGDFMVFDIESKDNVKVLVFHRDGSERIPGMDGGDGKLDLYSPDSPHEGAADVDANVGSLGKCCGK